MDSLESIDSKFKLALLAAKRAKQLVKGGKKKVDMRAENPLTIAIEEIRQGKIDISQLEHEDYEFEKEEKKLNDVDIFKDEMNKESLPDDSDLENDEDEDDDDLLGIGDTDDEEEDETDDDEEDEEDED